MIFPKIGSIPLFAPQQPTTESSTRWPFSFGNQSAVIGAVCKLLGSDDKQYEFETAMTNLKIWYQERRAKLGTRATHFIGFTLDDFIGFRRPDENRKPDDTFSYLGIAACDA